MGLPAKLKNFNVTVNGDSYAGVAGEVTLPKIAAKVEGWRGGGMLAEVDIEMGLEKLEMEMKFGGLVFRIMRGFGAFGVAGQMIRFNGAYQEDAAGLVRPAELVTRGKFVEIDPGHRPRLATTRSGRSSPPSPTSSGPCRAGPRSRSTCSTTSWSSTASTAWPPFAPR